MPAINLKDLPGVMFHTASSLLEAGFNQAVSQPIGQSAAQVGVAAKVVNKAVVQPTQKAVMGSLGISGDRMSRVDTAWLRMDSASNLMMIVGVWVLKPGITYDDLTERIDNRLLKYRRFTQKVVQDPAGATWVTDTEFSMPHHVHREVLKRGKGDISDEAALKDRVGELAMAKLDASRPLWQFHLVENYVGDDGQKASALIARIHHCIADGIALIAVMMSLVDGGSAPPTKGKGGGGAKRAMGAIGDVNDWVNSTLLKPFGSLATKGVAGVQQGMNQTVEMLLNPAAGMQNMQGIADAVTRSFGAGGLTGLADVGQAVMSNWPAASERAGEMARVGYQAMGDAAALALMPDDSPTRLKGRPGGTKKVAWCEPLPLEDVRAVSKALGCSINDVLLGCVAGAIGAYLEEKGDSARGKEIRAMVPVNLRPLEQAYKLGNRFGLVPVLLPIGMEDSVQRVFEVRRRMSALKGSYQPLMAFSLLAAAGFMVKPAQDAMLNLFAKKTTAVMTNVPGPKEKLKFCGATLDQTMFWVPQSGDVGLGVSILSYGGGVQFGVITDGKLCPDPQAIIDEFMPEFVKLLWTVLMLPWDGEMGNQ